MHTASRAEGSGGVAGFAGGGATVRLEAEGENETVLHYAVDASIGGKLAQLGARLIDSKAKKLVGEFFEQLSDEISPQSKLAPSSSTESQPTKESWLRRGLGFLGNNSTAEQRASEQK